MIITSVDSTNFHVIFKHSLLFKHCQGNLQSKIGVVQESLVLSGSGNLGHVMSNLHQGGILELIGLVHFSKDEKLNSVFCAKNSESDICQLHAAGCSGSVFLFPFVVMVSLKNRRSGAHDICGQRLDHPCAVGSIQYYQR